MDGLRIENLTHHERERLGGYWTAEVHNGDAFVRVTSERGSWQTDGFRHHVRPAIAAWLQREVGKIKRREARA